MKFICIYANKFKIREVNFKKQFPNSAFFNPIEAVSRFNKSDHTNEFPSQEAINFYIFSKVRKLFEMKEVNQIFYVIESFEDYVFENILEMLTHISSKLKIEYTLNLLIFEKDEYLIQRMSPYMKKIIDKIIIYET